MPSFSQKACANPTRVALVARRNERNTLSFKAPRGVNANPKGWQRGTHKWGFPLFAEANKKVPTLFRELGRKIIIFRGTTHILTLRKTKPTLCLTVNGVMPCRANRARKRALTEQAPKGNAAHSHISARTDRRLSEIYIEHGLTSS